jgi:hypothetical protein
MSNKQSSVEWLNDELASLNFDYLTGQIDNKEYNERHKEIIEQAKAMHKEEMVKFALFFSHAQVSRTNVIDEYNETFGGNND